MNIPGILAALFFTVFIGAFLLLPLQSMLYNIKRRENKAAIVVLYSLLLFMLFLKVCDMIMIKPLS